MSKVFFFNDTATTEIYTLSLHDALPIYQVAHRQEIPQREVSEVPPLILAPEQLVVVAEFVAVVAEHLGDVKRRQHRTWIGAEIEDAKRCRRRGDAGGERVPLKWLGVAPETTRIQPEVGSHDERQRERAEPRREPTLGEAEQGRRRRQRRPAAEGSPHDGGLPGLRRGHGGSPTRS